MKYNIGRQLVLDGYLGLHLKPYSLIFNWIDFNCVINKWKKLENDVNREISTIFV